MSEADLEINHTWKQVADRNLPGSGDAGMRVFWTLLIASIMIQVKVIALV